MKWLKFIILGLIVFPTLLLSQDRVWNADSSVFRGRASGSYGSFLFQGIIRVITDDNTALYVGESGGTGAIDSLLTVEGSAHITTNLLVDGRFSGTQIRGVHDWLVWKNTNTYYKNQITGRTYSNADEQTAIQATVDSANAAGGGSIFVKNGTYTLDDSVKLYSNIEFIGESRDNTIFVTSGAFSAFMTSTTSQTNNVVMKNFTVNGNRDGTGNGDGISIDSTNSFVIHNVRVMKAAVIGMDLTDSNNGKIIKCLIDSVTAQGIRLNGLTDSEIAHTKIDSIRNSIGINAIGASTDNIIHNNTIQKCGASGIVLALAGTSHRNTLNGNIVQYVAGNGIAVQTDSNFVSNNRSVYNGDNTDDQGILLNGAYNQVNDNEIHYNTGIGIDMGGADHCLVEGNRITYNNYGIEMSAFSTTGHVEYNEVVDNFILNNNRDGIWMHTATSTDTTRYNLVKDNFIIASNTSVVADYGINLASTRVRDNWIIGNIIRMMDTDDSDFNDAGANSNVFEAFEDSTKRFSFGNPTPKSFFSIQPQSSDTVFSVIADINASSLPAADSVGIIVYGDGLVTIGDVTKSSSNLTVDKEINISGNDPGIIFDESTSGDTDFWFANNSDQGGDDDDKIQFGTGTTVGSNSRMTLTKDGNLGLGDQAGSPTTLLYLGDNSSDVRAFIQSFGTNGAAILEFQNDVQRFQFGTRGDQGVGDPWLIRDFTNTRWAFAIKEGGTNFIGIGGTITPEYQLHLNNANNTTGYGFDYAHLQVTGNTTTSIDSVTTENLRAYTIDLNYMACQNDGTECFGGEWRGTYKHAAGTLTELTDTDSPDDGASTVSVSGAVSGSGSAILIQFTGISTETWEVEVGYQVVVTEH